MAKYISTNELDTFEFHDARFLDIELSDDKMVWQMEQVNVTARNPQNMMKVDMEAGKLFLTFINWKATKIEHYGFKTYDREGNLIADEPNITAPVEEYNKMLAAIPADCGWISCVNGYSRAEDHYELSLDILSCEDSMQVDLEFSEVKAEWDDYIKEAWYVNFGK